MVAAMEEAWLTARWTAWICAAALVCAPGCDSGGGGGGGAPEADPLEPVAEPAVTTAWSPDPVGTVQMPSYGNGCRFRADKHLEFPANADLDDALILEEYPTGGYDLWIQFSNGSTGTCVATLDLIKGLAKKSFRSGAGTSKCEPDSGDFASLTGQVVDGALCFDSKLEYGVPVSGEFSIVVQNPEGEYVSIGGDFDLAGEHVFLGGAETLDLLVDTPAVQMDLQ
jgi:hypothetical protein